MTTTDILLEEVRRLNKRIDKLEARLTRTVIANQPRDLFEYLEEQLGYPLNSEAKSAVRTWLYMRGKIDTPPSTWSKQSI